MENLNNNSKVYNFEGKIGTIESEILDELKKATIDGKEYFVLGEVSERTTGFHRGSLLSTLISNLKKMKEQSTIFICIKNTYEDLDFYSRVLEKVPGLYFHFDREYATKYSNNSLEEWQSIVNKYSVS